MEEKKKKRFKISPSTHKTLRIIAVICLLFDDFLLLQNAKNNIAVYLFGKIQYFTRWCHILTLLYFILTLTIKKEPKNPQKKESKTPSQNSQITKIKKKIQKNLPILYQIIFSTQSSITIMYWLVLHKKGLQYRTCPYRILYVHTAHSLPFLNLLLEFFFNDYIFESKKCFKIIAFMCVGYTVFLGFLELNFEIGVYETIDYKDWKTVVFALTGYVLNYFGWKFSCYLEQFKYVVVFKKDKKVK